MPYVKLKEDGTVEQQVFDQPDDMEGWHEIEAMIEDTRCETWVPGEGKQSLGYEAEAFAIDDAHNADQGPNRKAIDYAVKEIEARLFVQGIDVQGRLAREAVIRDVPLAELAEAVIANADDADVELPRVQAKVKAKETHHVS